MKIYKVGGSVRDKLLGIDAKDQDFVVVGATVEEMLKQGFKPVGKEFPVFLHPQTHEEYALARTEKKVSLGYQGFTFFCEPEVTLEQDLYRRDLTINAIAETDNGNIIDPYGGEQDLNNRILRHVSIAFSEDPVRVLRVARFAARYHHLGFTIADETIELMTAMVTSGEVDALVMERVWNEISRALTEPNPQIFFEVLKQCGALNVLLPEVNALFGVPQSEQWHPEIDTGIHTLMVLKQARKLANNLSSDEQITICYAALVHDLGKALTPKAEWPSHKKHEFRGVKLVENLSQRLKVSKLQKELALVVTEYHLYLHRIDEIKASTMVKFFNSVDAFRRPERFQQFLLACEADSRGRLGYEDIEPIQIKHCQHYLQAAQAVNVQDVIVQGFKGAAVKEELDRQRIHSVKVLCNQLRE
ncbi:MAG: multifunctional CCA addition/repair protein [Gammaproteobacteria bacterium]|nr:multifunctional CCA addition/repair protein [Gammaproteobacteria bacterium]